MNYRNFQERKRFERIFYSGWSIMFVVALLFVSITGVLKLWAKDRALRAELDELHAKTVKVKEAKEEALKKIGALGVPEGIEAEARGRFNLKKEGEELVVFMDNSPAVEEKAGFWASAGRSRVRIWQTVKNWFTP